MPDRSFDYIIVGGGLQSGLIASALAHRNSGTRVAMLERAGLLGGTHTWCFHGRDVSEVELEFVEPFVAKRWAGYRVAFPEHTRSLEGAYSAVTSESFRAALGTLERGGLLHVELDANVVDIRADRVRLASGRELSAEVVIDARGPQTFDTQPALGFQKFVGLELAVEPGHDANEPLLMDARVEQTDGFRFFYVLPFAPDRILVEDTYYSEGPELDRARLRREILEHARRDGFVVRSVVREEAGVLPLPARAPLPFVAEPAAPIRAGYGGGFFHPTTGYSFPIAARLARVVAESPAARLREAVTEFARSEARQQRFAALLNRMLFRGFAASERYRVLERFYRLPPETIARFYALALTPLDRARILCGRPPRGFSCLRFLKESQAALPTRALPGDAA